MQTQRIYDVFVTDQNREIIIEDRSVDLDSAKRIMRDYPWQDNPKSYAQIWKQKTRYSLSVHYMASEKKFHVGFTDKASVFKLPLPYIGAKYGILNDIDEIHEPLRLFFEGEFEKLEQFLEQRRPRQKGD
jgi:hypothetical protein